MTRALVSAMFIDVLLLVLGLALVGKGGDVFVHASIGISQRFRIPRIVVGGTIVSLATTMPETVVSVTASAMGDSGIAIGNAVGSTIANVGLIVGIVALIARVRVEPDVFNSRARWMLAAAILLIALSWHAELSRRAGLMLVLVATAYLLTDVVRVMRRAPGGQGAPDSLNSKRTGGILITFLLGAGLLLIGSRFLVNGGASVAAALGVPSAAIGLSIVAVGTSLPELVTGIVSARKGAPDLSLGNILGANVLNLALISGLVSIINPLTLSPLMRNYSFPCLLVFVVLVIVMLCKDGTLVARKGSILLAAYVLYLVGLVLLPLAGW